MVGDVVLMAVFDVLCVVSVADHEAMSDAVVTVASARAAVTVDLVAGGRCVADHRRRRTAVLRVTQSQVRWVGAATQRHHLLLIRRKARARCLRVRRLVSGEFIDAVERRLRLSVHRTGQEM